MPKKEEPLPDFAAMTPARRMRMLEALWDAMERNPGNVRTPAWHDEVVSKRVERVKTGAAKMLSPDEFKRELRKTRA